MNERPIRLVQISDIHLFADKQKSLLGVKTYDSFVAILNHLSSNKKQPDHIILSGDLSQDYSEASYTHLINLLTKLTQPIYFIPGNHDQPILINHFFPQKNISNLKQIILNNWQLILLDSQKPSEVYGYFEKTQLEFLEKCLSEYPKHRSIIFFHHHPVPVGSRWLDQLGVVNADDFWALLKNFSNVHTIFFGHVHQQHEGSKQNIKYYSVPSTCIQFKTNSAEFSLENLPQGYRWIDLYPDGQLKTGIVRLDQYIGEFQQDAKGY